MGKKKQENKKVVPKKEEEDRAIEGVPGTGVVPLGEVARVKKDDGKDSSVKEAEKKGLLW